MNYNREIKCLLQLIANGIGKRITDKNGNLDVEAFNKQRVIKMIVKQLKSYGVKSADDLADRGFMVASMILKF